ncbi:MAG: DUF4367 domain-containing protein [Eubacteriales bacterium]
MDKKELNEKILDEILKYAAAQNAEDMSAKLPSNEELDKEVTFSPEFTDRMSKYFAHLKRKQKNKRLRKTMFKVAASAAAVLIIFTTVVFSVDAVRVSILNIFSVQNDDSTTIHIGQNANYDDFADEIHGLYLPSYISPSYSVQSVNSIHESYYNVLFANDSNNSIELQSLLEYSSAGVDNEGAEVEQITVNGSEAQFFSKSDINMLIFQYNQKAFSLKATISKEELIKMAESMEYRQ